MPVDIQSSSVFTEPAAESYGGTDGESPSNVSKEDSERFSELLKEKPAEGRQEALKEKPSEAFAKNAGMKQNDLESGLGKLASSSDEPQSAMASLFSQTNMGAFASQFNSAVQGSAPQEAPMLNAQEVQQIAERILVSAPESGAQEVRITPNSNLLPGTEIIVARDANGMLQVSVKTTDPAAFQTLVGAQGDLKDALQSRETQAVRVVIASDEAGAGDNDSRRRSAGLFEQQQEQEG
jgi:hypothetical protein